MMQPICTYNICFAATNYLFWSDTSASGVPIWYFAYPEDSVAAHYDWGRTAEILDSFETYFGEYPFDKYGMATTPFGLGGMEHQTMTFLGDGIVTGTRYFENVVAHELSHSWFGNSVGLADWRDFWLNEGFATFSEFLYTEIFDGDTAAIAYRQATQQQYRSSGENFPMYDPDVYLSYTCYNKGGCVFQMLRFLLGDSLFFAAVHEWTSRYRYGTVTTDSLQSLMEEFLGASLDWFFDQWAYQSGYPRFEYWYASWSEGDSFRSILHIEQNNPSGPAYFITPLEVKLETTGGDIWDTIWINTIAQSYYWTIADSVSRIRIDPNYLVLRATVVVSDIAESPEPNNIAFSAHPNPFNNACEIQVLGIGNRESEIAIYDLGGNRVAEFTITRCPLRAIRELIWCPDESIPSGIYLIRATIDGRAICKRIVYLR